MRKLEGRNRETKGDQTNLLLEKSSVVGIPSRLLVNLSLITEIWNDRELLVVGFLGRIEVGSVELSDSVDPDLFWRRSERERMRVPVEPKYPERRLARSMPEMLVRGKERENGPNDNI